MSIGMDDVIADYIQKPAAKAFLSVLNKLVPLALAAGALYAIVRLNFGA
jgi:succinate dehydrogenase hydrophobic anchor subunit